MEEGLLLRNRLRSEASKQIWIILPIVGFNTMQNIIQMVSIMFVGHLSTLQLSSASIATSVCNVTGFSFLAGLAFALDTLCGQAFGAKQHRMVWIFVQRAAFLFCLVSIPLAIVWFNMERVMIMFRQNPEISDGAGSFARWRIPGLFAYAFLQPTIKFFQTRSKASPLFWCAFIALLFHIIMCWILTYKLEMGIRGAALSVTLSDWIMTISMITTAFSSPDCREGWPGFTLEIFGDILPFIKLAIPSALMNCLEWWAFEALILMSGALPNPELESSVFSIILNLMVLWTRPSFGISAAVSVRTSNELGAGNPQQAKFAFHVSLLLSIGYSAIAMFLLALARNDIGHAFSNDKEVYNYVTRMIPWLIYVVIPICTFQCIGFGVASGVGWQALAAMVNIGAYYAVAFPVAYYLTFHAHLQGKGLLIGLMCGCAVQAIAFMVIILATDWERKAVESRDRLDLPLLDEPETFLK